MVHAQNQARILLCGNQEHVEDLREDGVGAQFDAISYDPFLFCYPQLRTWLSGNLYCKICIICKYRNRVYNRVMMALNIYRSKLRKKVTTVVLVVIAMLQDSGFWKLKKLLYVIVEVARHWHVVWECWPLTLKFHKSPACMPPIAYPTQAFVCMVHRLQK